MSEDDEYGAGYNNGYDTGVEEGYDDGWRAGQINAYRNVTDDLRGAFMLFLQVQPHNYQTYFNALKAEAKRLGVEVDK